MTQTIYKYTLEIADINKIEMPYDAEILCVQVQYAVPRIWALVDPDPALPKQTRTIRIVGTGHQIEEGIIDYIGSFQLLGGDLIFHVFEIEG